MLRRLVSMLSTGLVFAVELAACSSGPETGSTNKDEVLASTDPGNEVISKPKAVDGAGLPCDVQAVLKAHCQNCHGAVPSYGAPMSLVSHADLTKATPSGKTIGELVKRRVHDDARPMPPSPNPRLSAAERSVLDGWIDKGARVSNESCASGPSEPGVKPLSCKPDTTLKARTAYKVPKDGPADQYVCFGVDVELAQKRHVVGLAPRVDNTKVLHHILLFQSDSSYSADPKPCQAFGSAAWKMVSGWAPGGGNLELPAEAGFPENKGTTHWIVQLHYNNPQGLDNEVDQSGYDLCTTEQLRPNDAGILAFGGTNFSIPPRSTTTLRCDFTIPSVFPQLTLFNAAPHMHTLGTAMSTERIRGGGPPESVVNQPNFAFSSQSNLPVQTRNVAPGDLMRTRCTWKNPATTSVGFGENTGDEMCFNFLGYYPAVPDVVVFGLPVFTWVTPSSAASCVRE